MVIQHACVPHSLLLEQKRLRVKVLHGDDACMLCMAEGSMSNTYIRTLNIIEIARPSPGIERAPSPRSWRSSLGNAGQTMDTKVPYSPADPPSSSVVISLGNAATLPLQILNYAIPEMRPLLYITPLPVLCKGRLFEAV